MAYSRRLDNTRPTLAGIETYDIIFVENGLNNHHVNRALKGNGKNDLSKAPSDHPLRTRRAAPRVNVHINHARACA
jgi:hypothetical protein